MSPFLALPGETTNDDPMVGAEGMPLHAARSGTLARRLSGLSVGLNSYLGAVLGYHLHAARGRLGRRLPV
jgi:hypothetical protein